MACSIALEHNNVNVNDLLSDVPCAAKKASRSVRGRRLKLELGPATIPFGKDIFLNYWFRRRKLRNLDKPLPVLALAPSRVSLEPQTYLVIF